MRLAIIVNPVSGRHDRRDPDGADRIARARSLVGRRSADMEVRVTSGRGHAAELAREYVARDFDAVIAWGGDGTVNEVSGPLVGTRTRLGVIASGSGDGLARGLGLRLSADAAIAAALSGAARSIDVGYLGGRHFLSVAGVGFDAVVAGAFNLTPSRGALGYVTRGVRELWRYQPRSYRVRLDERARDGDYFLIAFFNGCEYGNGMTWAPGADPADGQLDAVTIDGGSPIRQLWRARRLAFRQGRPASGITLARVRTASVAADKLMCHVDGETFARDGVVDVTISPGVLRVCAR